MNKQELIEYNKSKILSANELIKDINDKYNNDEVMTSIVSPLLSGLVQIIEKNNEYLLSTEMERVG